MSSSLTGVKVPGPTCRRDPSYAYAFFLKFSEKVFREMEAGGGSGHRSRHFSRKWSGTALDHSLVLGPLPECTAAGAADRIGSGSPEIHIPTRGTAHERDRVR